MKNIMLAGLTDLANSGVELPGKKIVWKYSTEGYLLGAIYIEEKAVLPANTTDVVVNSKFVRPVFKAGKWAEGSPEIAMRLAKEAKGKEIGLAMVTHVEAPVVIKDNSYYSSERALSLYTEELNARKDGKETGGFVDGPLGGFDTPNADLTLAVKEIRQRIRDGLKAVGKAKMALYAAKTLTAVGKVTFTVE